jgi:hypothetical protein
MDRDSASLLDMYKASTLWDVVSKDIPEILSLLEVLLPINPGN